MFAVSLCLALKATTSLLIAMIIVARTALETGSIIDRLHRARAVPYLQHRNWSPTSLTFAARATGCTNGTTGVKERGKSTACSLQQTSALFPEPRTQKRRHNNATHHLSSISPRSLMCEWRFCKCLLQWSLFHTHLPVCV